MDPLEILLSQEPRRPSDALDERSTGIYALWGVDQMPWPVGFPAATATKPLYIGKAQKDSIGARVGAHLGNTRWSAPRRSLVGLLLDALPLRGHVVVSSSDPTSKFGLDPVGERMLTAWISEHITMTWIALPSPGSIEESIIGKLRPPLNDSHATGSPYIAPMRRLRAAAGASATGGSSTTVRERQRVMVMNFSNRD